MQTAKEAAATKPLPSLSSKSAGAASMTEFGVDLSIARSPMASALTSSPSRESKEKAEEVARKVVSPAVFYIII